MDVEVKGLKPQSQSGAMFQCEPWCWPPLAEYVLAVCSDVMLSGESDWLHQAGVFISAVTAREIGERLHHLLRVGSVHRYELRHETERMSGDCWACAGGLEMREMQAACLICHETGKARASSDCEPFSSELVGAFADFCAASGGFEIW